MTACTDSGYRGRSAAIARRARATFMPALGAVACLILLAAGAGRAFAQAELLPLDHPATRVLMRIYEAGAIAEFPREHLPISRGLAFRFLGQAAADPSLASALREQAAYYRDELAADIGARPTSVFIPTTDSSDLIYAHPFAGNTIAIIEHRDTALGLHVAFEPLLDGELRADPSASGSAFVAQGGAVLRGTALKHIGFSARVTNGSVAGDSTIALRDPRIRCNGSFGVTGYGRDLSFGDGHLRADFDNIAAEIGHEKIQLGGGGDESLLLTSRLPCNFDYIRLSARFGRVAFTHVHAALLGEATGDASGPFAQIPPKYFAAHLLSIGPFAGLRFSLGESVIYQGRPFDLGYLNPLVFMKTQEQYEKDRDNANLYLALSYAPTRHLFVEGEMLVDDLRFSQIGKGFWSNKTAWRVGARARAFPIPQVDLGVAYTRFEPYVFTHFNVLNNYTHGGTILAGGGQQPNSSLAELKLTVTPLPSLWLDASVGIGRHGANVVQVLDTLTGHDTVVVNVGGDVGQTHRAVIDPIEVSFLDGILEKTVSLRVEAEYEPLRNVYLRFALLRDAVNLAGRETSQTEVRFGLRIGAH